MSPFLRQPGPPAKSILPTIAIYITYYSFLLNAMGPIVYSDTLDSVAPSPFAHVQDEACQKPAMCHINGYGRWAWLIPFWKKRVNLKPAQSLREAGKR
mgnify:FL=1